MGTNSRDLRVRFLGDASDFKAAAGEVTAGAAATGAALRGTDDSARTVSQSFSRTGKALKATGKIYKASGADALSAGSAFASTIPALSGVAAGAGQALTAVDALGGVLAGAGPAGLAAVGVAAVGAAAAYALLHDDVSAATDALRDQQKVNAELADSHKNTGKAVGEQKTALRDLEDNTNRQKAAALGLEEANRNLADAQKSGGKESLAYREAQVALEKATVKVADAERKHGQDSVQYRSALLDREKATRRVTDAEAAGGKGSIEYQRALLAQQQAQQEVNRAKQDAIPLAINAITTTRNSSKAVDDEVKKTHEAADAARARAQQIKLGLISGDDAEKASKEIAKTLQAEAKASAQAAAKHKDNAQGAQELAKQVGTATPRAKALHDRLLELARTELSLAEQAAAVRDFGGTVRATTSDLLTLYSNLRSPPAFSIPGASGPGIPGPGTSGGKKKIVSPVFLKGSNELSENARRRAAGLAPRAGELNPITRSDRADAEIAARARDNSLQDTLARERAPIAGISNPDKIAAIQDKAVAEIRKKELDQDAATVRKARTAVEGDIRKKRATRAAKIKARRKTPQRLKQKNGSFKDNPAWQKLTEAIDSLADAIRSLWDEHRTLGREYADIQAEAAELGHTIGNLTTQIASLPDAVPDDTTSTSDSSSTTADASTSVSPDQQAQIDQANARASVATAERNASDAFLRGLAGATSIDPASGVVPITVNFNGGVIGEIDAAGSLMKTLARVGFVPRTVFPSGA